MGIVYVCLEDMVEKLDIPLPRLVAFYLERILLMLKFWGRYIHFRDVPF